MVIPGRAPVSSSAKSTSAAPIKKALSNMRSKDTTMRLASTADSLRMSLSLTYSGLEERESVLAAIDVLETAQGCGYGSNAEGDAEFVGWLEGLEQLKEEDITDEDELGEGFGHKAVGSWKYTEPLKIIDTWGTAENAFKTIAALLRVWGMGREQLRAKGKSTSQPIIHNHIGQVCERILTAFKIAKTSGQHQATDGSAPSEPGPSTKTKKPRARVSKELDEGIVSATALKRLSKKSAADFLDKANIKYSKRAKKEDLIDMLINAHSNDKIKITAEEVRLACSKVDNDKQ
ncbi:hypothetical protein CF327_g4826 [Tilletia walkeri]|nr:hypothetical protein CF327_g4826 [Tilletia walkeri]